MSAEPHTAIKWEGRGGEGGAVRSLRLLAEQSAHSKKVQGVREEGGGGARGPI